MVCRNPVNPKAPVVPPVNREVGNPRPVKVGDRFLYRTGRLRAPKGTLSRNTKPPPIG